MKLFQKFGQILDASLIAIANFLLAFYRVVLSPFLGGSCRFEPSCSVYAQQAFQNHSFISAFTLSITRVISCRPGGPYGFDPCPCSIHSSLEKGTSYESVSKS